MAKAAPLLASVKRADWLRYAVGECFFSDLRPVSVGTSKKFGLHNEQTDRKFVPELGVPHVQTMALDLSELT